MKKIAFLSAMLLAMGFTSCDNYEEPNPPAQSNPQATVISVENVDVEGSLAVDEAYDLVALTETSTPIEVATILCDVLPEGYAFDATVEISNNNFSRYGVVPATVSAVEDTPGAYAVSVAADDLAGVYVENISKSPNAKEIQFRINVLVVNGTEKAYLGGENNYYGPFSATVVPYPSELVIEDAYYLVGSINEWDVATAVKLNHTAGVSGYDDPVFTIKVDISNDQAAEGWWWKILPESTVATGGWVDADNAAYGVTENGSDALEGILTARTATDDCGAGCLTTPGQFLLTINLEEGTYAFTSAVDYLYTPGNANGWTAASSMQLFTDDYVNYFGYAVLDPDGFKFTTAPDWDHTNYGSGGDGILSTTGENISVAEKGLYWCHVNTASLTYELTLVSTIGVVGDATPGGWDASTALTPSADFKTWTGSVAFGNGEWKFRANDGWDVNLGGEMQNLVQGGDNLASPGAGTYTVTLQLGTLPYACTVQ